MNGHLAILVSITPGLPAAAHIETDPRTIASGDRFEVIFHFDAGEIADQALRSVQAVWPHARDLYGLGEEPFEDKMRLHVYRTRTEYNDVDRRMTGGSFHANQAFSHWNTRTSHIALQPPLTDDELDRVGLPNLTRSLLIHEATHLVQYNSCPNYRSHPTWLTDGAACWVEQKVMRELGFTVEADNDPEESTALVRAQVLLEEDRLPAIAAILRGDLVGLNFFETYAVRGLFFRFLRETRPASELDAVLSEACRLAAGESLKPRLASFAERNLSPAASSKSLDRAFARYVRSFEPVWDQVYRSFETAGPEWTQIAFPDENAVAWRTAAVGNQEYVVTGTVELLPGDDQQMNVLLGRRRTGTFSESFVSVAIRAGSVTIYDYDHERGNRAAWRRLGTAEVLGLLNERELAFRIEVSSEELTVKLAGEPVLTVDTMGRALTGPFGLGAQSGSGGIWRDVQVSPR